MDAAPFGVLVEAADARVLSHNAAFAELVGSGVEVVGRRVHDLWASVTGDDGAPLDPGELPGSVAFVTGEQQPARVMRLRREDGQERIVQITASAIELAGHGRVAVSTLSPLTRRSLSSEQWMESENAFKVLTDAAPVGIFVSDPAGRSLYVNRQAEVNTGRPLAELRDIPWRDYVHPDDIERMAGDMHAAMERGGTWITEHRILRPDGTTRWVRSRGRQISDEDGAGIALIGTIADVTDLHDAVDRLAEREERTRAILESAAEGIVSTDLSGLIVEFNAAAESMFGYDSSEVVDRLGLAELIVPPGGSPEAFWVEQVLGGPDPLVGAKPRELVGHHADGRDVPIEVVMTEVDTSDGRILTAVIRDLSRHKALTAEIEHRTTHDELTGLPNRLLLDGQLDVALARSRNRGGTVAVLSVLLDRLSVITGSLGHGATDELVCETASRITRAVEPASPPARLAHDQFAVMLEDLGCVDEAVQVAQRIIEAINHPFILDAGEAFASAYVGINVSTDGNAEPGKLIADAVVAMRRAAEQSINGFEIFDPDMRAQVDERRRSEVALRHGIDRDELELFYQPIIELATGERSGAEALIRWNRPGRGLVLPGEFIPIAEDSGLILRLGRWVIDRACHQVAAWQRDLGTRCPPVSVNLSARQLSDPDLVDAIASAILHAGADPSLLAFEITETALLDDVQAAVATLESMKELGVRLCLDDFGTGFSSLTYLSKLPIDVLKIDRSFVSGGTDIDEAIVAMILGLASTLDIEVVAEGVETHQQAARLTQIGCTRAQGFLFAKPAPASQW